MNGSWGRSWGENGLLDGSCDLRVFNFFRIGHNIVVVLVDICGCFFVVEGGGFTLLTLFGSGEEEAGFDGGAGQGTGGGGFEFAGGFFVGGVGVGKFAEDFFAAAERVWLVLMIWMGGVKVLTRRKPCLLCDRKRL